MRARARGLAVVALIIGVVGLVVALVVVDLRQDRVAVLQAFVRERVAASERIASDLSGRLASLRRDIKLFRRFVERASATRGGRQDGRGELDRLRAELRALIAVAPHYRLVVLAREDGERIVGARDPAWVLPHWLADELDRRIQELPRMAPGSIHLGPVIQPPDLLPPSPALRILSTPVRLAHRRAGVLMLVLDNSFLSQPLKSFLAGDRPELLLVNAFARHPVVVADSGRRDIPPWTVRLLRRRFREDSGRLLPDGSGSEHGRVVTFARLASLGRWRWQLLVIGSTAHLEARQRENLMRAVVAVTAVALTLGSLGWLVLGRVRREAELRERLRSASEISHLHELARRILDNVPSGILTIDREGRILEANAVLLSWHPGIRPGAGLENAFPGATPQVLAKITTLVDTARAHRQPGRELFDSVPLVGEEPGTYVVRVVPLEVAGVGQVAAMVVVQDLSEVRRLEENLLHAEKLATIGTLTAGIAHEIGTPLGVIRARAEHSLGKAGDEASRRSLTKIIDQCDAISRIIQQVLDFVRRRDVLPSAVVLEPVIDEVAELLHDRFAERQVELVRTVPPQLPPLEAEADGLRRVLVNLLKNSCDACAPGNRVEVRVEPPEVGARELRIQIRDDGRGIAPEDLGQIFDPFFTTKKRGEGTGLGLAIARDIVQRHGGALTVSSSVGQGAVFTIRWPLEGGGGEAGAERRLPA